MRRRKILAIVAACLVATTCPSVVSAGEVEQQEATTELYGASETVVLSGDCSATAEDNVKWQVVRKEGGKFKIIISGTGNMKDSYDWHTDENDPIQIGGACGLPELIEKQLSPTYGEDAYISDVEILEGVKTVGGFYKSKIERVSLPNSITSIADNAFAYCSKLSEINIPDSVTYIGAQAFFGCGLKNVTIPTKLETLGWGAFLGSTLTSVTIPPIKKLNGKEFSNCYNLKKVIVEKGNKRLSESMFADWMHSIYEESKSSLEEIVLPEGLETIGYSAFNNCTKLKEIIIPESVNAIEEFAFYRCSGLTELKIPEGVKEIGGNAWARSTNLKAIYLPNSIEKLYSTALSKNNTEYEDPILAYGTSLTDIYYNGTKEEWKKIKKYIPHITIKKDEATDGYGNPVEYSRAEMTGWDETDEDIVNTGVTVHFLKSEQPTSSPTPKPTATVAPGKENSVTMYRLYNALNKEHFYTASTHEKDVLVTRGWKYEGVGWYAPEKSNTPVYRLYNPFVRDHHYTTDANEKNVLSSKYGWIYEGIGWYSDDSKGVPLYRRYCPILKSGSHHYTTALNEAKHLVSVGWKDEGIAWYGLKTEKK